MNIEPSLADAPAIKPEMVRGQLWFTVHGIMRVRTLGEAMDLIQDRRLAPRPAESFGAHVVASIMFQHLLTLANVSAPNGRGTLDSIPGVPDAPRGNGYLDRAPWETSAT